jgi:hypothetical protein
MFAVAAPARKTGFVAAVWLSARPADRQRTTTAEAIAGVLENRRMSMAAPG